MKANSLLLLRYLILIGLSLLSVAALTQVNQQYIFLHLGTNEGLTSNETQATVQDAKGYIWIAGKNGLQRYDGKRFVNFTHIDGDTNSLPHNYITQLAIDNKNRLWLTTENNKLGYFDMSRFEFHNVVVRVDNKLAEEAEGVLKLDLKKNILFILQPGAALNNVLAFNEQQHAFIETDKRFKLPVSWSIFDFSIDSLQHDCWIATTNGLVKFNPQTNTYSYRGNNKDNDAIINAFQSYTSIENTLKDDDGNFWMNTTNVDRKSPNLFKYDAATKQVLNYSKEISQGSTSAFNSVMAIAQSPKSPVLIGGRGVFIVGDDKLNIINSNMPGQYSIYYYEIRNINFDREKNCWISTDNGIYRMIVNTEFKYIDSKKYNNDHTYISDIVDLLPLPNGNIVVASWGSGLFEYDSTFNPVKSNIVEQADAKQEKLVWSLLRRSNGDVWSTHQDGYLYVYHAASNRTERLQDSLFENATIRQIAQDRNGDIWLGTTKAIIKWQQQTNTFKLIQKTTKKVYRLYADTQGDIWALAGKAMQFNVDNDSIQKQFTSGNADGKHLLGGEIVDIVQRTNDEYIIASEGLNLVNTATGKIDYFTAANGLPTNYISNIIFDKEHTLWIFTENGVCNLDFKRKKLSIYTVEDGISNSSFTPTSSTLLNDGRIVVGTIRNVLVFDPAKIAEEKFIVPNIEITGISIMNVAVNAEQLLKQPEVVLRTGENSISVQFSSLSYKNKYGILYKLDGLDKQWRKDDGRGEAVYSYLPPGNYVFQTGVDTVGNIKVANSFSFTIQAPFYRRAPFYFVIALLVILIVWRINRERIKRIKDILITRSNIGKELHNEVSNTLKNISVLSEIAAMKADINPEQSKDYIQEIKLKSRSTVIAMDDVMWSIDPANDSMEKITERMHEIGDAVYHEYNTRVNLEINAKAQRYHLPMKERLELMLIYKKALLMLAAHAEANDISVILEPKKDDLVLKLFTQGRITDKDDVKLSKEMDEIKQRAAAIQCEIELQAGDSFTAFIAIIKQR